MGSSDHEICCKQKEKGRNKIFTARKEQTEWVSFLLYFYGDTVVVASISIRFVSSRLIPFY